MASFSLDKAKLAILIDCIRYGLDDAGNQEPANPSEDLEAIAALLEELDAIAAREGTAKLTVMGDQDSGWERAIEINREIHEA